LKRDAESSPNPGARLRLASGGLALTTCDLALRMGQGPPLDQETATFIAMTASAVADDDGKPRAVRLGASGEQRIARRKELEIVKADAAQAGWSGRLHHQKAAGSATPMASPFSVQRLDHHQVRRPTRLLYEAIALALRQSGRNPMGAVQSFDRRMSAPAEAQPAPETP